MELLHKSTGSCLKRKLDDSLTEHPKSRHVEVENVSSQVESGSFSDPFAHRCCIKPNLADDCVNYLRSSVPSRVVFYKGGSWCNFPEQILPSLVDAFKDQKSSVVVVMDNQPLLVDFLSMTLVNLQTKKQCSVAWLDGAGKWCVPSLFFDEEASESTKLDLNAVEGSTQRITGDKVVKLPPETLNQVVLENISPVPQNSCTADILRNMLVSVERGSERFMFVQNLFLSGMGSFAMPNSIVHIHRYSPKHITAQCRLHAFEKQIRLTSERCGATRYGWLGSKKQDIVKILMDGFVSTKNTTGNVDGILLSPENRAFTSVGLCDVDESGVQYMLLCQAILGNVGSSYLIRTSHLSTHLCLEYLISFRLAPNVQEYLGQKGLWFHPPPKQGLVDLSNIQPENKITRKEMVKKMVLIIGMKLLVDSLTKLDKNSPSLWYKSPAKVAIDTINTTVNSICVNTSRIDQYATPTPDCVESCDPSVPITVHTVHASVPRGVPKKIPFLRTHTCDSVVPRLGTNGHAPLTQNSASIGMKGLRSVMPGTGSKVPESLPTGLVPECMSATSSKGSDAATSSISPQIQSPSILHRSCARSMAPHLHVPIMAPHLRIPSKTSQAHTQGVILQSFEKSVILQAQYSGAGPMIPVSSTPPTPSGAPKGNATAPTSSEEPKHHQTPELGTRAKGINGAAPSVAGKSPERTANLTVEEHKDSTLKSTVSSNVASQSVASNTVPIAADVLVGLSGCYEKGR
ncbi:hypothetical protein EJB05_45440 [Eragrostis curvula]|uniref:PARP catalytic domain-containing protein n=1 Tax=Eragrostis curvula TaxID=38414 RepID=A0A5J9TKM6_9POAL|nr:hypothetical protein EJB05_45440 [Eragrostis curvula]